MDTYHTADPNRLVLPRREAPPLPRDMILRELMHRHTTLVHEHAMAFHIDHGLMLKGMGHLTTLPPTVAVDELRLRVSILHASFDEIAMQHARTGGPGTQGSETASAPHATTAAVRKRTSKQRKK